MDQARMIQKKIYILAVYDLIINYKVISLRYRN